MTFMSLVNITKLAPHYLPKNEGWVSPGSIQLQPVEACQLRGLAQQMAKDNFDQNTPNHIWEEKHRAEQLKIEEMLFLIIQW